MTLEQRNTEMQHFNMSIYHNSNKRCVSTLAVQAHGSRLRQVAIVGDVAAAAVEKTTPGTKESCLIHPLSVMRRWEATTASRGVRQVERGLLLEVQREAQRRVFFFSKCLVSAAGQTSRASRLIRMAPLSTVSGSASFIVVQGRAQAPCAWFCRLRACEKCYPCPR